MIQISSYSIKCQQNFWMLSELQEKLFPEHLKYLLTIVMGHAI